MLILRFAKTILFCLFSIFLFYRSVEIFQNLQSNRSANLNHSEYFILAFLFNAFVTGVFAFPGFVFPTHKLLPLNYYSIRNAKHLNLWYKYLGVKYFRKLLMVFFWGSRKNRKKYFDGKRSGLKNLDFQSKQSEFGHLGAFVVIGISSLIILIYGHYYFVLYCLLINFIGNFYPILLQRKHRYRISLLKSKFSNKISN